MPIGLQLTTVTGPLARRIADLRTAFDVLAGPTWRDRWTVPVPLRGPELGHPVRAAVVLDPGGQGTVPQVQEGVRKAARAAFHAFTLRQSLLRAWGEFHESHPLVVAPICTDVPFEVGADRTPAGVAENLRAMRMAMAVNALGLPAVAVPLGIGEGLPQVVQLIGPAFREDLCLDAAEALERRPGVLTPIEPKA